MKDSLMRRRVDVQKQVQTKDSTGSVVPTWVTVWSNVPCAIQQVRGREYFTAQQTQADVGWTVSMRWRPGLDAAMRCVEYTNEERTTQTVYNVEAVLPDVTNRRNLDLLCRTVLNDGFRADGQ